MCIHQSATKLYYIYFSRRVRGVDIFTKLFRVYVLMICASKIFIDVTLETTIYVAFFAGEFFDSFLQGYVIF